jgi:uncharacterized protein
MDQFSVKRFGRPSREMVGVLQEARQGAHPRARFLLCRPLGQEAVRTAAVYRVLADRLAREGAHSMRFDYHGTGDSPGEEVDQTLTGWIDDTLAAHELMETLPAAPIHWFGMGLGATLALRAALRAKQPPAHLVLWEPVMNGPAYGNALLIAHRAELTREFGEPWERLLQQRKVVDPTLPGDVLGFEVGKALADELAQLRDVSLAPALRRGIRITCAIHADGRSQFAALEGNPQLKMQVIESRTDWMSSQAMGTAIVPPDLPRALISTLN